MFMTGNEIKQTVTDSVDRYDRFKGESDDEFHDSMDEMWDYKVEESHERRFRTTPHSPSKSLYESIAEEGAHTPITLWHPPADSHKAGAYRGTPGEQIIHGDGHHRTAAAAHIEDETGNPVYLPVLHDAQSYMYSRYGLYRQGRSGSAGPPATPRSDAPKPTYSYGSRSGSDF